MLEDRNGILWIGTNNGGLNRYNEDRKNFTSYYSVEKGLQCVTAIYEDRKGRMWVGTYLWGLFLFDRKTDSYKRFLEKDGLVYDNVTGIIEDLSGFLWISSGRGFSIMNLENFQIRQLTSAVGLPNDSLTEAHLILADGNFLIGAQKG